MTTPNAGYELIKRLLDNDLMLESEASRIRWSNSTQSEAPAIGNNLSKYRDVLSDYQFDILWDLTPSAGYASKTALVLAGYAPHPNAAKLLVNWLMGGGDEQRTGFEPWNVPGNFPVRIDMETPAPFKPIAEYNYWYEDTESYELNPDVLDFWLTHL